VLERALHESDERFQQLARSIDSVFYVLSLDPVALLYVSPAYERVWGTSRGPLAADPWAWLAAVHPGDRPTVRDCFDRQVRQGEVEMEYRLARPDGSIRWIRHRGFPMRDAAGQLYRLAGLAEDITDQRQVEQELCASRARLKHLVTANPAILYAAQPGDNYAVTFISENVTTQLGYEPGEFTGDPGFWASRLHPADRERVMAESVRQVALGEGVLEYRFLQQNGQYCWIHDEFKLALDSDGQPLELVGFFLNITERRRAEELKSTLLSSVSHDLQTPLASLVVSITELRRHPDPEWWATYGPERLAQLEGDARRLLALMTDLLDLAHLEAGGWVPDRELYEAADLIGGVLARFDERSQQRARVRLAPPLPDLWVDGPRVAQVLHNLLDNAFKYSPAGSPVVISASGKEGAVGIRVRNEGPGVPLAEQVRIFDRFYRGASARQLGVSGTGLGLAICRGIVEAHGGRLTVASDVARGTVFTMVLPASEEPVRG
jgi:PAS domain S-box-containing protein